MGGVLAGIVCDPMRALQDSGSRGGGSACRTYASAGHFRRSTYIALRFVKNFAGLFSCRPGSLADDLAGITGGVANNSPRILRPAAGFRGGPAALPAPLR